MKNYLNSIDALDSALQREGRYLIEPPCENAIIDFGERIVIGGQSKPDAGTADWRGFVLPFRTPDWLLRWWTRP